MLTPVAASRLTAAFLLYCLFLAPVPAASARAQDGVAAQPEISRDPMGLNSGAVPNHGNDCGPGSRPGRRPTDALDAAAWSGRELPTS